MRSLGEAGPLDRSPEGRHARVLRLFGEFVEDPENIRLDRLLEAFVAWKRSGQDRRGLCVEPGLSLLDAWGKRKIREREMALERVR